MSLLLFDKFPLGSAYVYHRSLTGWSIQASLISNDIKNEDLFGFDVSAYGSNVVVSAVGDDSKGTSSGAVYSYQRYDGRWSQQQKLVPSDGIGLEKFGISVHVDGGVLAVGATSGKGTMVIVSSPINHDACIYIYICVYTKTSMPMQQGRFIYMHDRVQPMHGHNTRS